MILLPRGNPVKEKVDPGRVMLPQAFERLRAGDFSGYLRFAAPTGAGVLVFTQGKLVGAHYREERETLLGLAALMRIFEQSLAGGSTLDIYRLSPELAERIHALLLGEVLSQGRELRLVDIPDLLAGLKETGLTGCLRIYTREQVVLILYRGGRPLGFFHDGSMDIETTAGTSRSVARLPGARIDVLSARDPKDLPSADVPALWEVTDLWEKARHLAAHNRQRQAEAASRSEALTERVRREQALNFLRAAAERHIGKIGGPLVDREFVRCWPPGMPTAPNPLPRLMESLGRSARLVAGPSAVKDMLEEMRQGVKSLF